MTVDGNDVLAVYETVKTAVERARKGEGPTLVECLTYRHEGHYCGDQAGYRPGEYMEEAAEKDAIANFRKHLLAQGVKEEEIVKVEEEITQEILDGDVPDEAIQARLEEQLRLMVAAIDQTSGQDQNRLREQARSTLIQQDQIMTVLRQYSGEGQKQALDATQNQVRNQLQNLGAGIPDPQLIRERIENPQETQMEMTPQSNRYGQPSDVPQPGQAGTPEPKGQPQGNSPQGFQYGLTITPTGTVTNNYQYQYYYGTSTGPMQNQFGQPSGNGTQDADQE